MIQVLDENIRNVTYSVLLDESFSKTIFFLYFVLSFRRRTVVSFLRHQKKQAYVYMHIRANDSLAPTKSAKCQGRAKLLMKLFKKQANFVLRMVSCYKTIIRHAKLLLFYLNF